MAARRLAVGVVGTGVIGRSWVRVFTRAGYETRVWDPDPEQVTRARGWLKADLKMSRKRLGLRKAVARAQRELVTPCESLEDLVEGTAYIQECAPDDPDLKRGLFGELDALAGPRTILASSTSCVGLDQLAGGLAGRPRCLIVHPVNPPHLIPTVEIAADDYTDPATVRRTLRFLRNVGQEPVRVSRFAPGLISERIEAAVLREAAWLVAEGVADADAVETVMTEGLGLRWALFGPLGTAALSADEGLDDHLLRRSEALRRIWADLTAATTLHPDARARVVQSFGRALAGVPADRRQAWLDEMLERFRRAKVAHPMEQPEPEA